MGSVSSSRNTSASSSIFATPVMVTRSGRPSVSVPPAPPLYLIYHGGVAKPQANNENKKIGLMTVPYCKLLTGGLPHERRVVISGKPTNLAQKFRIDFYVGADIAFSFNPLFDENVVVRNSKYRGRWENEVGDRSGAFPFNLDNEFNIEIKSVPQRFEVAVDGKHFVNYAHRMSCDQITEMRIKGDLVLHNVYFE